MNGYELSKAWYDFAYSNPRKIRPIHHALIFWIFELCNESNWANEFQLPTQEACKILGISDKHTFLNALKDLVDFGAVKIVQESTGRHVSRWIALNNCKIYRVKNSHSNNTVPHTVVHTDNSMVVHTDTYTVPHTVVPPIKTNINLENLETTTTIKKNVDDVVENEIPDFVKEEQKKIREQITPPAPPLEEIEANMRNSQLLKESAKRKNKMSENEYYQLLEDFFIETRATDKKIVSESNHKRHFLSWVRIQVEHLNKNGGSPPKGKIQSAYEDMSNVLNELNNQEQ